MLSSSKGLKKDRVRKFKRMRFEQLEHRQLMAGDVAVVSAPGEILRVTGDSASNQVVISREVSSIVVQGLNGTTVNGQSSVRFSGLGTTLNGLDVSLNGGDDSLFLDDLQIRQSAVINGDTGNDIIDLDDVSVRRDLTITSGDGANSVGLDNVVVNRNLTVFGGAGNDLVGFDLVRVQGLPWCNSVPVTIAWGPICPFTEAKCLFSRRRS